MLNITMPRLTVPDAGHTFRLWFGAELPYVITQVAALLCMGMAAIQVKQYFTTSKNANMDNLVPVCLCSTQGYL